MIKVSAEMTDDVALQLAQFCKRSTFDIFYGLTEAHLSPDERKTQPTRANLREA